MITRKGKMAMMRPTYRPKRGEILWCDSSGWISNGHWAARIERFANAESLTSPERCNTAFGVECRTFSIDKFWGLQGDSSETSKTWRATEWQQDTGDMTCRIFVSTDPQDGHQRVGVNTKYLKIFGLDQIGAVLYGEGPERPLYDTPTRENITCIIMPVLTVAIHNTNGQGQGQGMAGSGT